MQFLPIQKARVYGGQIMASAIDKAQRELGEEFRLVSYSTSFYYPIDSGKNLKFHSQIVGGGKNIKFVEIRSEGRETATVCVFSKEESTEFSLQASQFEGPREKMPYSNHVIASISRCENLAAGQVKEKYSHVISMIERLNQLVQLEYSEECTIIEIKEDDPEKLQTLVYISDILLMLSAARALEYPWYSAERTLMSTLQQSGSFGSSVEAGVYYWRDECVMFSGGKASVCAKVVRKTGEVVAEFSQFISMRIKRTV